MKKLIIVLAMVLTLAACSTEETVVVDSITETTDVYYTIDDNALLVLEDLVNLTKYYEDYQLEDYTVYTGGTITDEGTYYLTGEFTEAVIIDTNDDDVQLILDNVSINTVGPSILILDADDVTISLVPGSVNYVEDSAIYNNSELDAVIQGYSDIYINGTGTLNITANFNNAIYTNDDIKIIESTINITSIDDGIIGRDSVSIKDAVITMNVLGDGIVTTNDELEDKGYINIESGVFNLTCGEDAFNAVNDIYIYDGTFVIEAGDDGIQSDTNLYVDGGTFDITADSDGVNAGNMLHIYGGELTINALDDGLHSDVYLYISGGVVDIEYSYEGIESYEIVIDGGDISVYSTDDGINATVGGGQIHGETYTSLGGIITINGGNVYVVGYADGIDANGNITITGGNVFVYGSSYDQQSPIDYDETMTVTGGNIIAIGSTGMIQGVSDGTQSSILYADTQSYYTGTEVTLYNSDNEVVFTFEAVKTFTGMVISLEEFTSGDTYTLEVGTTTYDVTITSSEVSLGDGGTTQGMQPPGRR